MKAIKRTLLVCALAAGLATVGGAARAANITVWDFNGNGSGTLVPSIGSGAVSLIGGTTGSYVAGTSTGADGNSSDPVVYPNNKAYSLTTCPAQGTGNKSAGIQFNVSTKGYSGISLVFDTRHSATASAYVRLQYTTDGTNWTDGTLFNFTDSYGTAWFNGNSADLSSVAGVNNNDRFAFRLVSEFAPSTSTYAATKTGSNYGASGTLRYDMVEVLGTAVPEPGSLVAVFAGMVGSLGFVSKRRNR